MARRITNETKRQIEELSNRGFPPKSIANRLGISYGTAYQQTKLKERGFSSYTEYRADLAKKKQLKDQNNGELIKEKRSIPYSHWKELARKRQTRPENMALRYLIREKLADLGKTQKWLARELEVSAQIVSRYATAQSFPEEERLEKLFRILQVPYRTIDDLVA